MKSCRPILERSEGRALQSPNFRANVEKSPSGDAFHNAVDILNGFFKHALIFAPFGARHGGIQNAVTGSLKLYAAGVALGAEDGGDCGGGSG